MKFTFATFICINLSQDILEVWIGYFEWYVFSRIAIISLSLNKFYCTNVCDSSEQYIHDVNHRIVRDEFTRRMNKADGTENIHIYCTGEVRLS